jgi:hypothetical protein
MWMGPAVVTVAIAYAQLSAQSIAVAGVILEIEPPVFLRPAPRSVEIPLDQARDLGRLLLDGQAIRTGPSGRVRVALVDGVRNLTSAQGRFELIARPASAPEQELLRSAMEAYGRPGGTRGGGTALFCPANLGTVRLSRLEVKWQPDRTAQRASLELSSDDMLIWTADDIIESNGELHEELLGSLRTAISKVASGEKRAEFSLSLKRNEVVTTTFRILPESDERALLERQATRQQDDPFLRTIVDLHDTLQLGLLNEATDQLDLALAVWPRSETLLRAAVAAHNRTGNTSRAKFYGAHLGKP